LMRNSRAKTYQNKCDTPTMQLAMHGGHVLAST